MEMVLFCFPVVVGFLPCALAEYWKGRNGLPWLLLSAIPAYPLIQYNVNHLAETIGGNPMGASKAGIVLITSLGCSIFVSIIVALLPKKVNVDRK